MPRDGSNVYHKPFPDVVPDTTIESTVYNGFVADVEQDLNTPRPIIAGGTGANSASESLVNLGAETSSQVVTNFDSQLWFPGSFRAASSATASPVAGHAFAGWVYSSDVPAFPPSNQNVTVEARDLNDTVVPGGLYVREKKAGVWGPWVNSFADINSEIADINTAITDINTDIDGLTTGITNLNANKVAKAGDTMTGNLTISTASPSINVNATTAGQNINVIGSRSNIARWTMLLGSGAAETGGNAGSDFGLYRHNDAGAALENAFLIERSTGNANFQKTLSVGGSVNVAGNVACNGTVFTGGALQSTTPSVVIAGSGGQVYLRPNGGTAGQTYVDSNGEMTVSGGVHCDAVSGVTYNGHGGDGVTVSYVNCLNASPQANVNLIAYHAIGAWYGWQMIVGSVQFQFRSDGTAVSAGGGSWLAYSDARIKNVVGNYAGGLSQIASLQPVRFTYKGNETSAPDQASMHYQMALDGDEHIGLIAQDVEGVMPETVSQETAYIDGAKVTDLRLLDTGPILFALINSVRELKARVEALEAAP